MEKRKTFFYSKNQDDEFVAPLKNVKSIKGDYIYLQGHFASRILAFIAYRLIATPIAFIYTFLIKRIKIVNRELLKPFRKRGIVVYANHTQEIADALTPSIILFPKRSYAIVNANNVSLPVLGNAIKLLGALPLPEDLTSTKNFISAIETRLEQGHSILIYPEAHIWPYYTKIRDYTDASFVYPVKHDAPVFSFTTTYQKKLKGKGFRIVIYVDGPFFAPSELDKKSRQSFLHEQVINAMRNRASSSNYEVNEYLPKENI
ncbi:MAG: hypothetical protein EOM74_00070 [Methanomicrobia archaeon]|nr:hypothetical protein [Methanomicrobia archaeon]